MNDIKKYMTKFLNRYFKDLEYYANMTEDGCVTNIFISIKDKYCILHAGYNPFEGTNTLKISRELCYFMWDLIGNGDKSQFTNFKWVYFDYMKERFLSFIKDYVEKHDCHYTGKNLDDFVLSFDRPYTMILYYTKKDSPEDYPGTSIKIQ